MKKTFPFEFFFQIGSLVASAIGVHLVYLVAVRPRAHAVLVEQAAQMQVDPTFVAERSVWVVIRDFEQEACFILMLWAIAIISYKWWLSLRERRLLERDLMPLAEGIRILPEDTREFARPLEALPSEEAEALLPRVLRTGLDRFRATRSIQGASEIVHSLCESEAERLESELSMVRYIAWAIPSIGFIGTVRGIGDALGQAHRAVQGDIAGVTQSLGVAFNSTFIALLISIVLMFALHQLQLVQERLVFDAEGYAENKLISHLQVH
jgi:biopolymer transport protein ExbB/TolQ